jgi:hypothetical protein
MHGYAVASKAQKEMLGQIGSLLRTSRTGELGHFLLSGNEPAGETVQNPSFK